MSGSSTSGYDGHCLIMIARHLFEAIGPRRVYHRRSKMKPRGGRKCKPKWSQKWLQNSSKMAQSGPGSKKFGSGSKKFGAASNRGRFWSDFGCHLGPLLGSKIGPGTPQERHVDRFQPPGGSPGGSRRGSGSSFWGAFWLFSWRQPKKAQKSTPK